MPPLPDFPPLILCRFFVCLLMAGLAVSCKSSGSLSGGGTGTSKVDLTSKSWFPPLTRQEGNSCAQQAGLYYLLTAERNRRQNLNSSVQANRLSPYQSYAILADSLQGGSHVTDGWQLALEMGVPFESDAPRASRAMMHGFQKYVRSLRNKPSGWSVRPLRSLQDLQAVKALLKDGQLVACDFQVRGTKLQPRPEGGMMVRQWGSTGPGHTMVYAGYDDSIGFDFNGDGQITNGIDITGDGQIGLGDQERGMFLVINPWGSRWGQDGKAWAPYREHAVQSWARAGEVARVEAARAPAPQVMLKFSLFLKERSHLILSLSDGATQWQPLPFRAAAVPWPTVPPSRWELFGKLHRRGPALSVGALQNPAGGPLEMGIDLSRLNPKGPWSITLGTTGPGLKGVLHSASVVFLDRNGNARREIPFAGLPAILPAQGGTWSASP